MDKLELTEEESLAFSAIEVIQPTIKKDCYPYNANLLNAIYKVATNMDEGAKIKLGLIPNIHTIKAKLKEKLTSRLYKVTVTNYKDKSYLLIVKYKITK